MAHAFGHGWACDPLGPTDQELMADEAGAIRAWAARLVADDEMDQARQVAAALAAGDTDRVEWLEEHPETSRADWRGLAPAWTHRSGSGTVQWAVAADGEVVATVGVTTGGGYGECGQRTRSVLMAVRLPASGYADVAFSLGLDIDFVAPDGATPTEWRKEHIAACARLLLTALGLGGWRPPPPATSQAAAHLGPCEAAVTPRKTTRAKPGPKPRSGEPATSRITVRLTPAVHARCLAAAVVVEQPIAVWAALTLAGAVA